MRNMLKTLTIAIIACLACLLQACVPAVFVAGAATGGTIIFDHRSTKTILQDRDMSYKADSKIATDERLGKHVHISSAVFDHVVLLVGQAPTPELRSLAEQRVRQVPHIKLLHNEVTVEEPTSMETRTHDAWITTKVQSELFGIKDLHSSQIKVVTENSVVYMMGIITHHQADLATDKVRNIGGVEKVVKLFEYMH